MDTARTIGKLRFGFACQGIDVTAYSDSDIGQAVAREAWSTHNLIARAFARLSKRDDDGARGEIRTAATRSPMATDIARQLVELHTTRTAAITELRSGFRRYGFDVSAYSDNQLSLAILQAANSAPLSSLDLFACAFARLTRRH